MRAEDYGFSFKINIDGWREAAGLDKKAPAKGKIRIAPIQPINTKAFDEAVVLEYNGVPTAAGLKDRLNNHPYFVKEGEMKPIIDFINRL